MSALIEINDLHYHYEAHRPVLSALQTYINEGDITAILGPSGCGKSTLLRLIARLRKPTSGHIHYARPLDFGFVFQQPTLLDWDSVRRNVALPLRLRRDTKANIKANAIADQWLERVGLQARADDLPRALSGGMQMRVSFARAMAAAPHIVLLDEPFAALDELTRQDLGQVFRDVIKRENISSVFVTHSVQESVFLADRIIVLPPQAGSLRADIPVTGPDRRDAAWRQDPAYLAQVSAVSDILRGGSR